MGFERIDDLLNGVTADGSLHGVAATVVGRDGVDQGRAEAAVTSARVHAHLCRVGAWVVLRIAEHLPPGHDDVMTHVVVVERDHRRFVERGDLVCVRDDADEGLHGRDGLRVEGRATFDHRVGHGTSLTAIVAMRMGVPCVRPSATGCVRMRR